MHLLSEVMRPNRFIKMVICVGLPLHCKDSCYLCYPLTWY